ncbi:MAG: single-stranded DNA-binding protein [Candidatus Binatia bacterium]
MGEYNKVILLGNLTHEPELRYTPTGTPVCEFSLAVHHRHRLDDKIKEEVYYIDIVAFGQLGERSKSYLRKGSQVLVDGRLTQRRWETPEGKKRSKYEVVANTVQFVDGGRSLPSGKEEDLQL